MFDTSIPKKTHLAGVVENVGWLDVIMNDPATTDLNTSAPNNLVVNQHTELVATPF